MPNEKLTAQFCDLAYCPTGEKKVVYYDTSLTGFILECRPSGGKTFYVKYTNQYGKQRQPKVARHGDAPFDRIRKKAQKLLAESRLGGDPAAEKEEKRAVPTYATLAQQHLDHAKTYVRSYNTIKGYVENHITPRWGRLRLSEITQQDVAKWLAEKAGEGLAPATVEKIRVIFSRSFELALRWDMPGITKNPVKGIPRKPINNARERYLNAAETKRLITACEASLNPQLKHIVGLLLLTGARLSELLNAQWKHIDLEKRQWLIPTSKTGKARHVPLSQPAVAILEAVPRFDKCRYVLPNPETKLPFVSIKHAWQTARDEAKLPGLRLHDLRHSAASAMVNAGIDLFAVGRVLGHADHKSTMRYSHLAHDTLLAAVEAGAKKKQLNRA
ncbi:tyrosine-type recombinase/integrase [Sphingobium sp. PNB]|uniref:site-specific integrase n=1 Tax=Sphingobium sp. PNB TaxID=863934 RepID=UPI001CA3FE2A|nr:site-specific integrase [Sphingobium sp. PNB]MCB4862724.1 tyrosine-type recombinase/integrase [Sphingobium sp. PNB]